MTFISRMIRARSLMHSRAVLLPSRIPLLSLPVKPQVTKSTLLSHRQIRFASSSATLKEYGPIAAGVYLSMSFTFFCGCFASISFLGVDETQILGWFNQARRLVGFEETSTSNSDDGTPENHWLYDKLPDWAKTPEVLRIGTNVLLALAMTKLFVPVKVGLTAAITPLVARRLRAMGFQIGKKI